MPGSVLESDTVQKIQVLSNTRTCVKSCPQWIPSSILDAWTTVTLIWFLNVFFSLMVKANVQCMLNRPQNRLFWFKLNHVWARMTSPYLNKWKFLLSFPLLFTNLLIESIDDQNTCLLMPGWLLDVRSLSLSLSVSLSLSLCVCVYIYVCVCVCVYTHTYVCICICLVIHTEGKLFRHSEQAQRFSNGETYVGYTFCQLYWIVKHCMHAFSSIVKQAVIHVMKSYTLWQLQ